MAKKSVLNVMDIAEAFTLRPYIKSLDGYGDPSIHYDLFSSTNLSIQEIYFYLWVACPALPCMIERQSSGATRDSYSSELYPICRVARQFGYDQTTPHVPAKSVGITFGFSISWFLQKSVSNYPFDKQVVPRSGRTGMYSAGWLAYWGVCLEEWKGFVKPSASLRDQLDVPIVTIDDISLRMPNKTKRKASTIELDDDEDENAPNLHQRKKKCVSSQASEEVSLHWL